MTAVWSWAEWPGFRVALGAETPLSCWAAGRGTLSTAVNLKYQVLARSLVHWLPWVVITRHILPLVCRRWGKAAGCVAGWKATGEAQTAHQSSPQHLQCVWMSQHLLLAQCWPSAHHPPPHGDDRSDGAVSRAACCWCLRNWSPLSTQTARPGCQRCPLLPAEGSAQTWGGQQRADVGEGENSEIIIDRENETKKRDCMKICVFALTYMSLEAHRTPQ